MEFPLHCINYQLRLEVIDSLQSLESVNLAKFSGIGFQPELEQHEAQASERGKNRDFSLIATTGSEALPRNPLNCRLRLLKCDETQSFDEAEPRKQCVPRRSLATSVLSNYFDVFLRKRGDFDKRFFQPSSVIDVPEIFVSSNLGKLARIASP